MPAAMRSSVVLPQPDWPSRQAISPACNSKLRFFKISVVPMVQETFSKVSLPANKAPAVPRVPQRCRPG